MDRVRESSRESPESFLKPPVEGEGASPPVRDGELTSARILLIDDEETNLVLLRRLLVRRGFNRLSDTTDPVQALELYRAFRPDLICLDLHMTPLDGFEVLERLRPLIPQGTYLPILMLTSDSSNEVKRRALSLGATDFVLKPFDVDEVILRIHNLLVPRFMHLELAEYNRFLERKVSERTRALEESRLEVLERLARAAEFRDDATGLHAKRVGACAGRLAERVGLPASETELIVRAAPLHDIGKIGVPDQILLKPGKLGPDEFEVMKRHTSIGAELLAGGRTSLMRIAAEIALHHHERWDGSGYPAGLRGAAIPIAARLVALADVFDALTHDRPYRQAWPIAAALDELARHAGGHFDPALVQRFLELPHEELL